jgi:hypothetical protein
MDTADLPSFLTSHPNLLAHFDEHIGDHNSKDKGDSFLSVALKIIPLTKNGPSFSGISASEKQTHDDGVDIISEKNNDGVTLICQSKYKIRKKDEIDLIVSKFSQYEKKKSHHAKGLLFDLWGEEKCHFMIITLSDISEILRQYKKSELASKEFFDRLLFEKRLDIFHGPDLLLLLQKHYRRAHAVPAQFSLTSEPGWLHVGNSYVGIVKGNDLRRLHEEFGEALFFENIRDFLGPEGKDEERNTVNAEISRTIREQPGSMLERNNGITFRAADVHPLGENILKLTNANIVNGCQTTMCLVLSAESAQCCVAVKVVKTGNAWEITKTANAQNHIKKIELELARFLRPQRLRKAANDLGYGFKEGENASAKLILNSIYEHQIEQEEVKYLYLGIFSNNPANIFERQYADIRYDVLESFITNEEAEERVFSTIFLICMKTRDAIRFCHERLSTGKFGGLFKRFFGDDKSNYRIYFTMLTICVAAAQDISQREIDTQKEKERMESIFKSIKSMLENNQEEYFKIYQTAFSVLAEACLDHETDQEIQKMMYSTIKKGFKINLQKVQFRNEMRD